jgi:hypothetical protein
MLMDMDAEANAGANLTDDEFNEAMSDDEDGVADNTNSSQQAAERRQSLRKRPPAASPPVNTTKSKSNSNSNSNSKSKSKSNTADPTDTPVVTRVGRVVQRRKPFGT